MLLMTSVISALNKMTDTIRRRAMLRLGWRESVCIIPGYRLSGDSVLS